MYERHAFPAQKAVLTSFICSVVKIVIGFKVSGRRHTCVPLEDGSDELRRSTVPFSPGVQAYNVSCADGLLAQNRRSRQVPGSSSCVLPPYPRQGTYVVAGVPDATPGQVFESFKLTVGCRRGFGFVGDHGTGNTGLQTVFCSKGDWSQAVPECVRFCKLGLDPSVQYSCRVPGAGYKVCEGYVPPGTSVRPLCNRPVYDSNDGLRFMRCISGFWDHLTKCKPVCGRVTPIAEQLVIGGDKAKRGELPWHAGIYSKTTVPYMQICGGSLVSNNVIISAAHCFWSDKKKNLPPSDFAVAIGKVYRPWDSARDFTAQTSDIKEIRIPKLFQGQATNLQEDIAVLILTTSIIYMTYVRPVCLNFDLAYEKWQLQHGKMGKVAGWGLTETDGKASQLLKSVEMPYIEESVCLNTLPESFKEFITADKFCAGYTNGTALCKGDSGGGLAFAEKEFGVDRFYLRGVVSAVPNDEDKLCNDMSYTTFTKVTKHEEFIKEALAASVNKTCPPNVFQCNDGSCKDQGVDCNGRRDCADGSDEAPELCTLTIATNTTSSPQEVAEEENKNKKKTECEPIPSNMTSQKTGRIAFDKCIEYQEKYVYNCLKGLRRNLKCRHNARELILGGHLAAVDDNTHRVHIGYHVYENIISWTWAGTIISEQYVLTAATAAVFEKHNKLPGFIMIGPLTQTEAERKARTYKIKTITVHPEFKKPYNYHNIALLQSAKPFRLSPNIVPACLHNDQSVKVNQITASTFTLVWHKQTDLLLKVPLQKMSDENCSSKELGMELPQGLNKDHQACYENKQLSQDTCTGDIGGSLEMENPDIHCMYLILGVSSIIKCGGSSKSYGVFTRVSAYIPWIERIVWP